MKDQHGKPAPTGAELSAELASAFSIDAASDSGLSKVAQLVEYRKGRPALDAFLTTRFSHLTPDEHLVWLTTIPWRAVFTTNYDLGILRAYELNSTPPQQPISISAVSEVTSYDKRLEVPVYYLHGNISGPNKQLIITDDDYARFRERREMLFAILKAEFATSTFLYLGYSNSDTNWRTLLEEVSAEFAPSKLPEAYRIVRSSTSIDTEILEHKSIHTILGTIEELHSAASLSLHHGITAHDKLERLRGEIPASLGTAFDTNPAAVARLLESWEFVNIAPFDVAPNSPAFFRGDRPNWGLIAQDVAFERDIASQVYIRLLDYLVGNPKGPTSVAVLAPAGYGTTTLLMQLAARCVQDDNVRFVFMLRPEHDLLEGTIEFAASLDASIPTVFIVDQASRHAQQIRTCMQRLRDGKLPGLFLLGSRLNKWHESINRPHGSEFLIEPLSDSEIPRLVASLEKVGELGRLGDMSQDLQFIAIKKVYQKELLVVLREATEGKAFDAIIEDEYRGLSSDLARRAYLIVCCFYQHGVYIRAGLLSGLLGLNEAELYSKIGQPTEGVIYFDLLSANSDSYGARARHRTIATVVWARCGGRNESSMVQEILESLNLNYGADADAFEEFVQSDFLVDNSLVTLDAKIAFFEEACRKDPTSAYVRQHYARMFLRSEKPALALRQIDDAIELDANVRVLYHTKGLILENLALDSSSEIGRRRLVQSEAAFRQCIHMDKKDDYGYTGLANLFLRWARQASSDDESTDYINRAEATVSEGLQFARNHERLWVVSAEIQKFLGDEPGRVEALQRGLGSVASSRIARYLLGQLYRERGNSSKALEILKPVIEHFPEEYRSAIEYVNAMLDEGESYNRAIAIMELSRLSGMSDARFVATLGGLYFMAGRYTDAADTFRIAERGGFTFPEANRPVFYPRSRSNPRLKMRLTGRVQTIKPGNAWIDSPDLPASFFCRGTRFGNVVLRVGLNIVFTPAFSARGPMAISPTILSERGDVQALPLLRVST